MSRVAGTITARANFRYELVGNALTLWDLGPWDKYKTITNDIEEIVKGLTEEGLLVCGRKLEYYDSTGAIAGVRHMHGQFFYFCPVDRTTIMPIPELISIDSLLVKGYRVWDTDAVTGQTIAIAYPGIDYDPSDDADPMLTLLVQQGGDGVVELITDQLFRGGEQYLIIRTTRQLELLEELLGIDQDRQKSKS